MHFLTSSRGSIRTLFAFILTAAFAGSAFAANLKVVPTTTLTAETSNNTSAPNTIGTSTNGGAASGNISKLPVKSLLYAGANPKIYASLMGWWGKSGHISIGENSQSPAVVKAQVEDMQSRGIDGAIFAWYGKGTFHDVASLQLMKQAEAHPGFQFIIMIDQGTLQWDSMGMTATDAMIYHMNYLAQTYYNSPAYAKINGRPIVLEFGTEMWPVDWTKVLASVQGNPVMFFRNPGSFTNANATGGYGWGPAGGLSYTDYFNKTAAQHTDKVVMADAWKGFNDVLATWSQNRVTDYSCGQTWLNSMAELGKYYSASNPLPYLQLPTWNDYEEGTSIESGIDNCVTVSAATSGNSLQWTLGGAGLENTIDHYTAFVSTDGENLMPLGDVPAGTHSLDLSQFNLAGGDYTFFVKAVGKPSLKNQMSNAAAYTKSNVPPVAALTATPASALSGTVVSASTAGSSSVDGTIASSTIDFGDGTIAAGPSASHAYSLAGTYTVIARVTDNQGTVGTTGMTVTAMNRAPVASLSGISASVPTGTAITASTVGSSDPDGAIAGSLINFGDGASAAGPNAAHAYAAPGTYTITATVTDNMGATATKTQTVMVTNRAPNVVLGVTPGSGYAGVQVTATTAGSVDPDGTIASTVIDFGDGNVSNGVSHTHQYANAGSYVVKATVTDNLGAVSTATAPIVIAPATVAITVPTTATSTSPLKVIAAALSGRTVTSMTLYVDGATMYSTSGSNLSVSVTLKAGTRVLKVTALDNTGRSISSSVTVTVAAGTLPRATRAAASDGNVAARLVGGSTTNDAPVANAPLDLPRATRLAR